MQTSTNRPEEAPKMFSTKLRTIIVTGAGITAIATAAVPASAAVSLQRAGTVVKTTSVASSGRGGRR